MSNCEQNCEAVSNLNEYAANLIEYSKRIDSWLNGPQDAMVDVGGVPTPTLRNLVMALKFLSIEKFVQSGGGLSIDDDGKMYLDFSTMPKEKYEIILKQIRVPIWLSGNTVFYVNKSHPDASDSLEESGRGLSPDLPFKTIQAAINYVVNNYNMINFTALIKIAAGTYNENLSLGEFSRTTGNVVLTTYPGHEGQVNIVLSGITGINCQGGSYYLDNLNLTMNPLFGGSNFVLSTLAYVTGGELFLRACNCTLTNFSGITGSSYEIIMLAAIGSGTLSINPSLSGERQMSLQLAKPANFRSGFFYANTGAHINVNNSNISQAAATIQCSGSCSEFLRLNNGHFALTGTANYYTKFVGNVTGKRYTLANGSTCNTNMGETYLPGNADGDVQTSTYCWYN